MLQRGFFKLQEKARTPSHVFPHIKKGEPKIFEGTFK
jgi:hypothetical protein